MSADGSEPEIVVHAFLGWATGIRNREAYAPRLPMDLQGYSSEPNWRGAQVERIKARRESAEAPTLRVQFVLGLKRPRTAGLSSARAKESIVEDHDYKAGSDLPLKFHPAAIRASAVLQ